MTQETPSRPLQQVLLGIFVLLGFGAIFCMYYNPTTSWFKCPDAAVSEYNVCTEACLSFLEVKNQTQTINNCTVNDTLVEVKELTTKSPQLDKKDSADSSEVVILVWSWPFGQTFDLESCESGYGIKGCRLIIDRNRINEAHGVMFHVRDIGGDVPYLKTLSRPAWQNWVWMNMESPTNSPQLPGMDDMFNLTSNYRTDSDVWVPYGHLVEASEEDKAFQIPQKDKLVCWIVSHWEDKLWRVEYFNEFSQHINVEGYGRHFGRYIDNKDYFKVMSSCKFYLAFENSVHKDYITEKLFNPLMHGTVPVVIGPPRENYEKFIPADSFIHVNDFKTAKELAEHLKLLDQSQEMYEKYFAWRKHFVPKLSNFGQEHACLICNHLKRNKNFRVFKNVNAWYWG
ncbi:4-galactosyl-N-acetylglucosaminide 3-alpha-L-fucosyltransferase 9-like [Salminus brasiliensis]|uniref:4-galactosyl-N-acetylglucosaminide 3-alpha-L-fucosyltransferase 9-like n=1 Tax=Salminus brasiliensis TaxID=930266 RepID=UPI003B8395F0